VTTQAIAIYIAGILQYSFLGYWVGFVLNELIRALIKEKQAQQPSPVGWAERSDAQQSDKSQALRK